MPPPRLAKPRRSYYPSHRSKQIIVTADFLSGDGAPPWSRAARQAWFDTWCCVCLAVSFLVRSGSSSEKGGSPPFPPAPGSHTRVATKRRVGFRSPASHTRVATGRAERGSKKENAIGLGIYSNDLKIKLNKKITSRSSIMTADLVAIREAINEIEKRAVRKDKIVVLTDSLIIPQRPQQTTSETKSHRRDNRKNSPKEDYNTNLLDPSTLRNRRQRKS